jgi:DNA-binding response OmpR family regulator
MIGVTVVNGAQVRILVIDDEENIRDNLFAILKGEGYFVDTAETGSVALTKLADTYYNLILNYFALF